ncbi:MAG: hypothetical protein MUQ30_15270, partial [Anaerolineae bacterium]|nr:hypothetical protein [Anaerolineae bacterium]
MVCYDGDSRLCLALAARADARSSARAALKLIWQQEADMQVNDVTGGRQPLKAVILAAGQETITE